MTTRLQRINNEIRRLVSNENSYGVAYDAATESCKASISIKGVKYEVKITFPDKYPFKCPQVMLLSATSHPNIHNMNICYGLMDEVCWNPGYSIGTFLGKVEKVLNGPVEPCYHLKQVEGKPGHLADDNSGKEGEQTEGYDKHAKSS